MQSHPLTNNIEQKTVYEHIARTIANESITPDKFKSAYSRAYDQAGFFGRNPFSAMNWILYMGGASTMEEIRQYIIDNPTSRSRQVFDNLITQEMSEQLNSNRMEI